MITSRQVSSMIYSVRPTGSALAKTLFSICFVLLDFVIEGRPSGSKLSWDLTIFSCGSKAWFGQWSFAVDVDDLNDHFVLAVLAESIENKAGPGSLVIKLVKVKEVIVLRAEIRKQIIAHASYKSNVSTIWRIILFSLRRRILDKFRWTRSSY